MAFEVGDTVSITEAGSAYYTHSDGTSEPRCHLKRVPITTLTVDREHTLVAVGVDTPVGVKYVKTEYIFHDPPLEAAEAEAIESIKTSIQNTKTPRRGQ